MHIGADSDLCLLECDVWPDGLTPERAEELYRIHAGHPIDECAVKIATIASLSGTRITSVAYLIARAGR